MEQPSFHLAKVLAPLVREEQGRDVTQRQIAKEMEMNDSGLGQIVKGKADPPGPGRMEKICRRYKEHAPKLVAAWMLDRAKQVQAEALFVKKKLRADFALPEVAAQADELSMALGDLRRALDPGDHARAAAFLRDVAAVGWEEAQPQLRRAIEAARQQPSLFHKQVQSTAPPLPGPGHNTPEGERGRP